MHVLLLRALTITLFGVPDNFATFLTLSTT